MIHRQSPAGLTMAMYVFSVLGSTYRTTEALLKGDWKHIRSPAAIDTIRSCCLVRCAAAWKAVQ
eukprot:c11994_g1_i1 orf=111-302(+)